MADASPIPPIRVIRKVALLFLGGLVAILALSFLLDDAVFRIRAATGKNAFGSVVVTHYYAVGEKGGKTEYIFDQPQPWPCVNSLFPHAGDLPCWYLRRHPEQQTNI